MDTKVKETNDQEGQDGRGVVHQKHDGYAEDAAEEGEPVVEVFKGRTPSWRLGDTRVERGEINQSVGGNEEIGEKSGDDVEVSDENTNDGNAEYENISSDWIIILA